MNIKTKLLFFFLFTTFLPVLTSANIIRIPKGWTVKHYAPQQEYIFKNPKLPEYITLKKFHGSGNALAVLHGWSSQVARIYPDFRYLSVKTNPSKTMAECEMIYFDPKFNYQEHAVWFIETNGREGFFLALSVKNTLFPYAEGWFNEIVSNLFHAEIPGRRSRIMQASSYLSRQTWERPINLSHVQFNPVNAGFFWIRVPSFWKVLENTPNDFQAIGSAGENFSVNSLSISGDPESLRYRLIGLQTMRLSPSVIEFTSRLEDPYLSPVQVVQYLYPKIAEGMVKNVKILGVSNFHAVQQSNGSAEEAVVTYEYQKTMRGEISPIEGASDIITLRPSFISPTTYSWTLISINAVAPPWVFQKEIPLFMTIAHSIKLNYQAILQASQNNQEMANEITNFGEESIQGFQNSDNLIASTGQKVLESQYHTWKNGYSGMMHNTYGWMEAYTGQQPYIDTNTGQKVVLQGYGLPGGNLQFKGGGGNGVSAGDVLHPVPLGSF
jgi:hypothetical protein